MFGAPHFVPFPQAASGGGSVTPFTIVSVRSVAPLAGAVQADTGPLAAGVYEVVIHLGAGDALVAGRGLIVEHRNAANTATLNLLGAIGSVGGERLWIQAMTIAQDERIRVIVGTIGGAANADYTSSIATRIAS